MLNHLTTSERNRPEDKEQYIFEPVVEKGKDLGELARQLARKTHSSRTTEAKNKSQLKVGLAEIVEELSGQLQEMLSGKALEALQVLCRVNEGRKTTVVDHLDELNANKRLAEAKCKGLLVGGTTKHDLLSELVDNSELMSTVGLSRDISMLKF